MSHAPTRSRVRRRAGVPTALAAAILGLGTLGSVGSPAAVAAADVVPAWAPPECATLDPTDSEAVAERAAEVDAVFAGEVLGVTRTRTGSADREPNDATAAPRTKRAVVWQHQVGVEESFVGVVDPGRTVGVDITVTDGTSGSGLREGRTYLFFVTEAGNRFAADVCNGAVLLPGGLDDELLADLTTTLDPAAPAVITPTLEPVAGADEDPPALSRMVAPGGALALIGLLGLVLVSRLGRERR